jgi:hypothetical protein
VNSAPALLVAAAGVALGHAVLPDHWLPLAVVGRTQHYPLSKVARLSGAAGVAHVFVSVVLGAIIIAVGLQFRSNVEHAQDAIVGGLLIATGIGFGVLALRERGHGHSHAHGPHTHSHDDETPSSAAGVLVPFGAAASPDLTILPVFLAATAVGPAAAIGSVVVFAVVTIGTIVGLTLLAASGAYQLGGEWLDRWGNAVTAGVLVVIGALVLSGLI